MRPGPASPVRAVPHPVYFPYVVSGGHGDFFCTDGPTLYAVVRTGGKQYRVEEGALLTVATLEGEPGKEVTFGDVLLLADGDDVKDAGTAKVTGEIVGHGKGEKIVVFRYKNKTRSRKRTGHRTKTTTVRITKIEA